MQPSNPIVGGINLRIPGIQSPNFITGVSGWAINQDGTAEFNGLTLHGTLVLGSGSNNVIILDFTRRALLVYDNSANLIASMAAAATTDSFGNTVYRGMASYDPTGKRIVTNLDIGEVRFPLLDFPNIFAPGAIGTNQPANNTTPGMTQIASPSLSNTDHRALIYLVGTSVDGTAVPEIDLLSSDGTFLTQSFKVNVQGVVDTFGEQWNQPTLNTNWANTGSGFGKFAYRMTPLGRVAFTGLIQWNAAATPAPDPVFTLPAGYRPNRTVNLCAQNSPSSSVNPGTETIQITTGGVVQVTNYSSGPSTPISFEGLEFYVNGAT